MFGLFATVAVAVTAVAAQVDDSAIVAKVLTANSQVAKVAAFNDSQFVFDFLHGSRGNAKGGFAVGASSANFPALLTGRGAMTVGVLGPCGANSPHTHPRATELQIVVEGGPIFTEFIMENGGKPVKNNVSLGMATIFPEGSIHFQQNMACEPTIFVASFDNVDPGTSSIANNFFALDQGVVDATLGEIGVSAFDHLSLPANFILGAQECLDRCKIDRSSFNFSASFGDYAMFSNSTWTAGPASSGKPKSGASLSATGGSSSESTDVSFDQNPLKGTVIGLGVTAAALFLAVLGLAGMMCCRRRAIRAAPTAPRFPTDTGARGYPYATPYDDAEGLTASRHSMDHKA